MRVLLLSPYPERLVATIQDSGDIATAMQENINNLVRPLWSNFDFIISYGYRYILRPVPPIPAINLHLSYLPWNRGADPNLWSWIDNTPKGVTIHKIDEGIDTGPIYIQGELHFFGLNPTLATSYAQLQEYVEGAFAGCWKYIRNGECEPVSQSRGGTYHSKSDRAKVLHLLTMGWDTPLRDLVGEGSTSSEPPETHS